MINFNAPEMNKNICFVARREGCLCEPSIIDATDNHIGIHGGGSPDGPSPTMEVGR